MRNLARIIVLTLVVWCGAVETCKASAVVSLNGAGASFPYPIYTKWISEYQKTHPDLQINYQSIGSGGGIKQVLEGTVDFGATDIAMTDDQLKKSPFHIVHIPTVLGAVVLTYNIPGIEELKLNGEVIADVFIGKITKWNDLRIKKINPTVNLPDKPILVAHRADGSGTTAIFTDYLSKISSEWQKKVGSGVAVNWPAGIGGKGNEGVTGMVKASHYSIGYVELIYAERNNLRYAMVENARGEFVKPTFDSVTIAASSFLSSIPDDFRISITCPNGKGAYPISGFTYLLVNTSLKDQLKASKFIAFLKWALTEGQSYAKALSYAPLPKALSKKVSEKLNAITPKETKSTN